MTSKEFDALHERYKSEWSPATAHEEFLVEQMAKSRWKLDRVERIEAEMFDALETPEKAFTDQETAAGFARLERYRASLERTYHRCAREIRASRKIQNEPKSSQTTENDVEALLKQLLEAPLPDFELPTMEAILAAADEAKKNSDGTPLQK